MLRLALALILPAAAFAGCGSGACCCSPDVVPAWQTSRAVPVKAGGPTAPTRIATRLEAPWLQVRRQGGKSAG